MFSGWVALVLFIIGGAIAISYKNPDGYKILLDKLFNFLGLVTLISVSMFSGMDMIVSKFDIPKNELGYREFLLTDYRYAWVFPLAALVIYFGFSLISHLTNEVKGAEKKSS